MNDEYKLDPNSERGVLKLTELPVDVNQLEFREKELTEVIAEKTTERQTVRDQLAVIYAKVPEVKPLEDNQATV